MSGSPTGVAIAWWYLSRSKAHCFVAAFVHRHRDELTVEIAEGMSSIQGFSKDDHIAKPAWSYSDKTRRQALSQVLKYAQSIVDSRMQRGFRLENFSFSQDTGTEGDQSMSAWMANHEESLWSETRRTPRPDWWPDGRTWSFTSNELWIRRAALTREGFDLVQLTNSARTKPRRKKRSHGRTYRRVGRFTVYAKD